MAALGIFVLETDDWDYDGIMGLTVAAASPRAARWVAASVAKREDRFNVKVWTDPKRSTCKRVGTATAKRPRVLLKAIRYG